MNLLILKNLALEIFRLYGIEIAFVWEVSVHLHVCMPVCMCVCILVCVWGIRVFKYDS